LSPSRPEQPSVITSSIFSTTEIDESGLTDINAHETTPPIDLAPNTTYYWRVRAYNSIDEYSGWSLVRSFRTAILPPTLTLPLDGNDLLNNRPTFDWDDMPGATSYTLQISRNNTFTFLVGTFLVTPSTYTPTVALPANLTLYWRVQSRGANGPSAWSTVRTVNTANPPSVPLLVAPLTNSLTTDYTPRLDWAQSTYPTSTTFEHYELWLDDNAAFSSPYMADIAGLANHEYTIPDPDALNPNTTYYWRIRTYNFEGEYSAWSLVRTFRTAILPPTLTGPADGETQLSNRPYFGWNDVPGATGYSIQISRNSAFTLLVGTYLATSSSYAPLVDLPANTTLYWRVQSRGVNGPSAWSATRMVNTANPPSIPVLISPANGVFVTGFNIRLDWSTTVDPTDFAYYDLEVSKYADFSFDYLRIHITQANSSEFTTVFEGGTDYYWRVRAFKTNNQYSSWSSTRMFQTYLEPVVLLSPYNHAHGVNSYPTFRWNSGTGATSYILSVYYQLSPGYPIQLWFTVITSSTSFASPVTFPLGVKYYWQVRASGPHGGSQSEMWDFTR
jgi:hypothetical protein